LSTLSASVPAEPRSVCSVSNADEPGLEPGV